MALKLYFEFMSQPSRAVYIFMKTCRIPFEPHFVRIAYGENRTEEYEEIHPFGKIPAIEHDGFKLIESVGIVRYLCREFKIADPWYPSSLKKQAKVDEYLEWQHLNTRLFCSRFFLSSVAFPMMRQKPPREETVKKCKEDMIQSLDLMENKWLKDKAFVAGDTISVADLFAACEIEQTRMAGYDPRQGRPRLTEWLDRVAKETAPHYAEAHGYLDEVIERLAGRPPHTFAAYEIFK